VSKENEVVTRKIIITRETGERQTLTKHPTMEQLIGGWRDNLAQLERPPLPGVNPEIKPQQIDMPRLAELSGRLAALEQMGLREKSIEQSAPARSATTAVSSPSSPPEPAIPPTSPLVTPPIVLVPPLPKPDKPAAPSKAPPTIQVTIGRVEVRATPPPTPVPKKRRHTAPVMSLDNYLRQRNGGKTNE
jgi:hypothetical protein